MDTLMSLINHHGYIILFASLLLELIALPVPTELLMSYVGFQAYQGHMNLYISLISGIAGTISGMSAAYWIGSKLGFPFFNKYGHRMHLGPERLNKMSKSFDSYGKRLLLFSCFIPGVRHFTGYSAGITRVKFKSFAFFSYIGAALWVGTFIILGRALGPQYTIIETTVKKYMLILIVLLAILVLMYYLIKTNLPRIKAYMLALLSHLYRNFNSQWQLKLLIVGIFAVFVSLVTAVFGLFDEYIKLGFQPFNKAVMIVFNAFFGTQWKTFMNGSFALTTTPLLAIVSCVTAVWIILHGKNRHVEMNLLIASIAGGYVFIKYLPETMMTVVQWLHWPFSLYAQGLPSSEVIMATIVYGYWAFLTVRHAQRYMVKIGALLIAAALLLYIGIGHLYFIMQSPSDIIASYLLGSVWLSFIIMLLEVWRLITLLNREIRKMS